MATCNGRKKDGSSCESPVVLGNGYCRVHQIQAPWTKERLQAAIATHGGPEGLNLAGADLSGLDLSLMDLHGIVLSRRVEDGLSTYLLSTNLQKTDLSSSNLQNADLHHANLHGADLLMANLQATKLTFTTLQEARLMLADMSGADVSYADLSGANLLFAKLQGVRFYLARLNHTTLKREQLGPAIGDELAGEYREARDAYLALKQNFEDLGDYEAAGWAYRKERRMEKLWARQKAHKARSERNWGEAVANCAKYASDQLVEWVCDYGEGIWRVVGALAAVWIIFAAVYGLIAGVWGPWQETAMGQMREITRNPIHLLAFSLGAMTTLEPAGLEARSMLAMHVLMPLEALLGIFFAGLLGFVAGNRIRRS